MESGRSDALLTTGLIVDFGGSRPAGALPRALARLAGGLTKPRSGGETGEQWLGLLATGRALRRPFMAHVPRASSTSPAALLASGLLSGLYLRGIAFEYHATWKAPFSMRQCAPAARRRAGARYLATGLSIPAVEEIAAIRAPAGENAARWLHSMAASIASVVILPRLLLALWAWFRERHHCRHFVIAVEEPYFQNLLRGFRGEATLIQVLPYSYSLPPAVSTRLHEFCARTFGGSAVLTISTPIGYGEEHALMATAGPTCRGHTVALFNATATPEHEAHGLFLKALAKHLGPGGMLIALVDESTFRARGGAQARLEERRRAWREICARQGVPCSFIDLAASTVPALAEAAAAFGRLFDEARR